LLCMIITMKPVIQLVEVLPIQSLPPLGEVAMSLVRAQPGFPLLSHFLNRSINMANFQNKHFVQVKADNGEFVDLYGPYDSSDICKRKLHEVKDKVHNAGGKKFEFKRGWHEVEA